MTNSFRASVVASSLMLGISIAAFGCVKVLPGGHTSNGGVCTVADGKATCTSDSHPAGSCPASPQYSFDHCTNLTDAYYTYTPVNGVSGNCAGGCTQDMNYTEYQVYAKAVGSCGG